MIRKAAERRTARRRSAAGRRSHRRFGHAGARRSLRLESLEQRSLLSATVGFDSYEFQFEPQAGEGIELDITAPAFLEIIDLNGDDHDDLFVINDDGAVSVSLFNPATGDYDAADTLFDVAFTEGTRFALGDVTGDGEVDLVVGNFSSTSGGGSQIETYVGDGGGGFSTPSAAGVSTISPDTLASLVPDSGGYWSATSTYKTLFLIEENGAAHVGAGFTLVLIYPPVETHSVQCSFAPTGSQGGFETASPTQFDSAIQGDICEAGDLDGDGQADYIALEDARTLHVFTTADAAGGALVQHSYSLSRDAHLSAIDLEDLDGDGKNDIVLGLYDNSGDSVALWLSGNAEAERIQEFDVGISPVVLAAGDLDGDNTDEILLSDGTSSYSVVVQNGDAFIEQPPALSNVEYAASTAADINGDGFPDLLAAATNVLTVRYGSETGAFGPEQILLRLGDPSDSTQPGQVRFAEVTGDQWLDLMVLTTDDVTLSVYAGEQDGFSLLNTTTVQQGAVDFALAHLDGDTLLDVVTLGDPSDSYRVLLNAGGGAFSDTGGAQLEGIGRPTAIALGDVDHVHGPDLLILDTYAAEVFVLANNGSNQFGTPQSYSVGTAWSPDQLGSYPVSITLAQVDADAWPDIITTNFGDGEVAILYNQQNGQFGGKRDVSVGGTPGDAVVADVNYDGLQDIVVGRAADGKTAVILGHEDPSNPLQNPVYFGSAGVAGGEVAMTLAYADAGGSLDVLLVDDDTVYLLINQTSGVMPGDAEMVAVLRDGDTPLATGSGEATLPAGREWVDEFGSYWVEVWATGGSAAIGSFSFGLAYDAFDQAAFTVAAVEYGPAFTAVPPTLPNPLPSDAAYEFVAGQTSLTNVGDDAHVLLARVKIRPTTGTSGVPLAADGWYPGPVYDRFALGYQQVTIVGDGTIAPQTTDPDTTLWAVPFDANDDGVVNRADYSIFQNAFGKTVTGNPVDFGDKFAGICDYDRSGTVTRADFSYFQNAFLASNTNGQAPIYPGTYHDPDTIPPQSPAASMAASMLLAAPSSGDAESESPSDDPLAALDLMFASYDALDG